MDELQRLKKVNKPELIAFCQEHELDTSGTKAILLERIEKYLEEKKEEKEEAIEEVEDKEISQQNEESEQQEEPLEEQEELENEIEDPKITKEDKEEQDDKMEVDDDQPETNHMTKEETKENLNNKKDKKKKKKKKKVIEKRILLEPQINDSIEIEYIVPDLSKDLQQVIENFSELADKYIPSQNQEENDQPMEIPKPDISDSDLTSEEESDEDEQKLSNRQKKKLNRLKIAELKAQVKNPDVVEWFDVSSKDPHLLVYLKSYKNTVPVPIHWSQKRKYLSGKRGIEKPPFELPSYIKDTGIALMRETIKEKEDSQKMKAKMRAKTHGSTGKLVIDYQKLHDAFFKHQTKPLMTQHGDLYYEGKEFETRVKEKKPGVLSLELKQALGMTHPLLPPPWLINMQRFGPPPSYPNLRIPGLNAPIPEGAQWGYHPGGWGKPPVDEYNRPLYGDVFGTFSQMQQQLQSQIQASNLMVPIRTEPWGEIEGPEEEEEAEEEEQETEEEQESEAEEEEVVQPTITQQIEIEFGNEREPEPEPQPEPVVAPQRTKRKFADNPEDSVIQGVQSVIQTGLTSTLSVAKEQPETLLKKKKIEKKPEKEFKF